jgi:hypothetical protein
LKNLNKNRGVTLVELVVAFAILALLGTAIVGILGSNVEIFRKNKADISVQTSAQEVYNTITEDLMQAKYVYVEGYLASGPVNFSPNHEGEATGVTYEEVKLLKASDYNLIDLSSSTSCESYLKNIVANTSMDRAEVSEDLLNGMTDDEKAKFNSFYNNVKSMYSYEAVRYGKFLDYVKGKTTSATEVRFDDYTSYVDNTDPDKPVYTLKKKLDGSTNNYGFYITRIIVEYSVPLDTYDITQTPKHVYDTSKLDKFTHPDSKNPGGPDITEYAEDYCIADYKFTGKEVHVSYDYGAMDELDSSGDVDDPSSVYSKLLCYVDKGNGDVSGVVGRFDSESDSFELDMYFADKQRNYNDKGMTKMRNSYVLHDAK